MSVTAHLNEAQMRAFKLFDSHGGTLTVGTLLDLADKGKAQFKSATETVAARVQTARAQIDELRHCHLGPLEEKRDRILAHIEPTIITDPQRLQRETKVTYMDLDAIFHTASDIINSISVCYSETGLSTDLIHDEDYETVIQYVADIKHEHADTMERLGAPEVRRPKIPRTPKWP
jgi:hypothetical protein